MKRLKTLRKIKQVFSSLSYFVLKLVYDFVASLYYTIIGPKVGKSKPAKSIFETYTRQLGTFIIKIKERDFVYETLETYTEYV